MNKTIIKISKPLAITLILAILLIAGCNGQSIPNAVCHATGDPTNPYIEVNVNNTELAEHSTHPEDIIPVPIGGCPTAPVVIVDSMISICHATGIEATPYEELSVNVIGLGGHDQHPGDFIPMPDGGCPTSQIDVVRGKIEICHATGSETNPYEKITVSVNGLNGHGKHADDIYPVPVGGCPATLADINDGKITICHATGNDKNPYSEITVSVNGLNGHGDHEGDIIPMPVGGCPISKK